jgi:methylated-DNA-protein-cysteine methyltransferase-like protein
MKPAAANIIAFPDGKNPPTPPMNHEPSFPQQVIALVNLIPYGKVLYYERVAELLGKPRNARAVGYAMNGLPFGTSVPWHRVVGKLGIYGKINIRSFSYSRDEQIARLKDEGIIFDEQEQFILIDYLWQPSAEELAGLGRGS